MSRFHCLLTAGISKAPEAQTSPKLSPVPDGVLSGVASPQDQPCGCLCCLLAFHRPERVSPRSPFILRTSRIKGLTLSLQCWECPEALSSHPITLGAPLSCRHRRTLKSVRCSASWPHTPVTPCPPSARPQPAQPLLCSIYKVSERQMERKILSFFPVFLLVHLFLCSFFSLSPSLFPSLPQFSHF